MVQLCHPLRLGRAIEKLASQHLLEVQGPLSWGALLHGSCSDPRPVRLRAIASSVRYAMQTPKFRSEGGSEEDGLPFELHLRVRCNHCDECERAARTKWAGRIAHEIDGAPRTWMVTLTVRPSERARIDREIEEAGETASFRARCRALGPALTKWTKRVRIIADRAHVGRLRLIQVWEPHGDGYPHVHVLLHSTAGLTKRLVARAKWSLGFTNIKLADKSTARYCAKYLVKSRGVVRPRTSKNYGAEYLTTSRPSEPGGRCVKNSPAASRLQTAGTEVHDYDPTYPGTISWANTALQAFRSGAAAPAAAPAPPPAARRTGKAPPGVPPAGGASTARQSRERVDPAVALA